MEIQFFFLSQSSKCEGNHGNTACLVRRPDDPNGNLDAEDSDDEAKRAYYEDQGKEYNPHKKRQSNAGGGSARRRTTTKRKRRTKGQMGSNVSGTGTQMKRQKFGDYGQHFGQGIHPNQNVVGNQNSNNNSNAAYYARYGASAYGQYYHQGYYHPQAYAQQNQSQQQHQPAYGPNSDYALWYQTHFGRAAAATAAATAAKNANANANANGAPQPVPVQLTPQNSDQPPMPDIPDLSSNETDSMPGVQGFYLHRSLSLSLSLALSVSE